MEDNDEEQIEKGLTILIMPSFDTVREALGYEEYDDFNTDSILYRQGYDGELINVEDEENFEISEGFVGRINSNEDYYLLSKENKLRDKQDYLIENDLSEGRYRLSVKDHVIYILGKRRRGI